MDNFDLKSAVMGILNTNLPDAEKLSAIYSLIDPDNDTPAWLTAIELDESPTVDELFYREIAKANR